MQVRSIVLRPSLKAVFTPFLKSAVWFGVLLAVVNAGSAAAFKGEQPFVVGVLAVGWFLLPVVLATATAALLYAYEYSCAPKLDADGIALRNVAGWPTRVRWGEVLSAAVVRSKNFPSVKVRSRSHRFSLHLPLYLVNAESLANAVRRLGGDEHPLTKALNGGA